MAMIQCPECNQPLSDQAYACPHCGYPVKEAPPPAPFKISLQYKISPSCPAATFIKVMSIIMLIGGIILAVAGSYQQRLISTRYGTSYDTVFVWENFFTVLLTYAVYAVFGLILSKVVRQVNDIHMQLSTLEMTTSNKEETAKAPEKKMTQHPNQHLRKATHLNERDWECKKCGAHNSGKRDYCDLCFASKPKELYTQLSTSKSVASNEPLEASRHSVRATPSPESNWICQKCGTRNPKKRDYCDSCFAPKPTE